MISKVEICGVNTAKLPVLKNEETVELIRKAHAGDMEAREKLINCNLRLVLSVLQKFQNRSESADDLFQVGCIGLIKAIDNFNPDMNVMFSSYGVPMILGEIRRFLRDNSPIRVSRSIRDTAYRVLKKKEELMADSQREPTVDEIAAALGIRREDVVIAMDAVVEPMSLNEPIYSESGDSVTGMDQIGDPRSTDEAWLEEIAIGDAIRALSDREKLILSLRFYEGKTQTEVAREIGISQAQVSRLEKNAIARIKKSI